MKKHLFLSASIAFFLVFSVNAQVHHWPLKADLNDVAGSLNGTNNGVIFQDDVTRGPVAYFDGESYANLPSFIAGSNMTEITVTCWFRMDESRVWSRVYSIGEGDQSEPKDVMMVIPVSGNQDMYRFTLSNPGTVWYDIDMPQEIVDIQLDTWYFSAVVLKPDSIILYHNNQKVFAESGFARSFGTLNDSENALGKSFWPDPLWKGAMSDFRVYETALDEAAVLQLYDETVSGWQVGVNKEVSGKKAPSVYAYHNKIRVELDQPRQDEVVSVYNLTGALVGQKPLDELGKLSFDTGIYIVRVQGSDVNHATKVFIR
ncbi:MAG: T9SS type A sorting domain-containing protein [Bacteroidales bacterium]|nr:T9SS type A sorting domain-containing protein [Bacteroidales bacterium]MDT8431926.1 LamG-like jellyroll fold domain-containing protein [Bacteroidales bacterium]